MVASVVSLASSFIAVTSSSSPSYSSSFLTKLRHAPSLRLCFAVSPLRVKKHMAHTIARATLGLTQISPAFEAPKLTLATKEVDVTEWKGDLLAVGVTEKDLAKDQNSKFENPEGLSAKSCKASAIASGAVLGIYEDNRYKSESKKPALKSVDILGLGTGPELEKKLKYAQDVASGIILGKELTNSPANVLTPGKLAEEASNIASLYSDVLSAKILNEEQCKDMKMGSYLAVAATSANPPHFIHLTYKPPGEPAKLKLALVDRLIGLVSEHVEAV